jgi:hypothetical protein
MSEIKEAIAKAPSGRPQRVPVGTRNILKVQGKDPAYEYRFINDSGDRVAEFLDAGYQIESADAVRVGDKRTGTATPEGSKAQYSVGQGQKALLVKIKKEWYDEDQAKKQERVAAQERATKDKALDGTYGKLELNARG